MAALDFLLMPIRRIMNMGVAMQPEPFLNIKGTGFTLVDNPANRSTDLTLTGGGGGGQLPLGFVQGTSSVVAAVNERYEVTLTNGTPGNSSMNTDAFLAAAPGCVLAAVRTDASGYTMTFNAPAGGSIQDPTTRVLGPTASLNTQDQAASWYISGNVLRLF